MELEQVVGNKKMCSQDGAFGNTFIGYQDKEISYQKLEVVYENKDLKLTHEQCPSQCPK